MEKIYVRITRGTQPYLYDCFAIPQGKAPVEICKDEPFNSLITHMLFLIEPQVPEGLDDYKFAKCLTYISALTEYMVTIEVGDAADYMRMWLDWNNITNK
jgi:hypothetical protein